MTWTAFAILAMFWVSVEEGIENLFLSHSPKQGRGGGGVGVGGPLVRVLNFWSENIFFVLKGRLIQQITNSWTKNVRGAGEGGRDSDLGFSENNNFLPFSLLANMNTYICNQKNVWFILMQTLNFHLFILYVHLEIKIKITTNTKNIMVTKSLPHLTAFCG